MIVPVVLLVVASDGYQILEYRDTRAALEKAGIMVKVASDRPGVARSGKADRVAPGTPGAKVPVDVTIDQVDVSDYAGIFLIGGPGALEHLDNNTVYRMMQSAATAGKIIGAICVSPRILAQAGLLQGIRATGWNEDKLLPGIFKKYGVLLVNKPVVVDGRIVTGIGPHAAAEFGQTIARLIKDH